MANNRNCLYCGDRFEARLERRLFCSDKCRVRWNREERMRCFYCGELADTRDHIFPHSAETNGRSRRFEGRETVNACHECNHTANNVEPFSLLNRIDFLIDRTKRRYHLDKPTPEWDDDEIAELGPTLRSAVVGKIRQRQRAISRVLHMRGVWTRVLLADDNDEDETQS